ncbi:MAG: PDZ domain-containing protein [Sulfurimonas sp.]|nr:PDZ domain-containing protein [Sulfurimonas sp.]
MLRLFLALNFLLLNLYACKGGYDSCILKVKDSSSIDNSLLKIPVINHKRLLFSVYQPNTKIIKYDPFLSLYLVKDKKNFKHPFKINNHLSLGMASINKKRAVEGRITKRQVGLNSFAKFSEKTYAPSLLLNSCCALEGLVTPRGIIEKRYVQRFLNNRSSSYGDIGIRAYNKRGLLLIKSVNPFFKDNPFKKNDRITMLDGRKIKRASVFMRKILFSKVGAFHKVKVKRGSKYLTFKVKTKKRYGGGYISDTFLEGKGVYFSNSLSIIKITNKLKSYGLKRGDKLIQVNAKKVKNSSEVRKYMGDFISHASLLFERDGFEFFVNIKAKEKNAIISHAKF